MTDWQGKTLLVIGAARQGLAATRYLATHGSKVILTDSRPEKFFIEQSHQFVKLPVRFVFGGHPLTLLEKVDAICVSGGVPTDIPLIKEAKRQGIPLTNDAQLFMDQVQAKVIGITGSAGKTTTTTLIGEIARACVSPSRKVWVGGNIGNPLIEHIEEISPKDWIVMELSSFQLDIMHTSPSIALVLNITPNHLDRHKTMAAYTEAKANILRYQTNSDTAILNRDDFGSFNLQSRVTGELITFGFNKPGAGLKGTFLQDDKFAFYDGKNPSIIMPSKSVRLIGKHNLLNSLAACAAGIAAGFNYSGIEAGIKKVEGIPHRLELIRDKNNIRWYNDSIATSPERVMAALEAIPGKLVLLLGGRDKKLPWAGLAAMIHKRKPKIILFGESASMIKQVLTEYEGASQTYPIIQVKRFNDAVTKAAEIVEKNETVLLSPGGTSYDAFHDFEERGNLFKKIVEEIE
ncbi:MAG: UDP-N-acetylmuramoyl-L-alanine--D-glutamate ligase [Anaerolineaceae bacterium]|nr:UDP-N-acetylmuramoyl-L-alanine--D-glutamate ligase [Anaerolineaceae bacterium]